MSVYRTSDRRPWWQKTDVCILALLGLITVALVTVLLVVSALLNAGLPSP